MSRSRCRRPSLPGSSCTENGRHGRTLASLLLAAALLLGACGDGDRGIDDSAAGPLAERVAALRAAAAQDPRSAGIHVVALREEVARLRQEGALSEEAASRILQAADGVEAAVAEVAPPTTVAPTTTAPPPPAPSGDDDDDEDDDDGDDDEDGDGGEDGDEGDRGGKGKGRGKDD